MRRAAASTARLGSSKSPPLSFVARYRALLRTALERKHVIFTYSRLLQSGNIPYLFPIALGTWRRRANDRCGRALSRHALAMCFAQHGIINSVELCNVE
jgi:hypothetical protein